MKKISGTEIILFFWKGSGENYEESKKNIIHCFDTVYGIIPDDARGARWSKRAGRQPGS